MSNKIDRAIAGEIVFPRGFGTVLTTKDLEGSKWVAGLDIEADSLTAEPFMLSYATEHTNAYISFSNPEKLLDFFTSQQFRSTVNFFYNLQYDFEGMLKLFRPEIAILIFGAGICYMDERGELTGEEDSCYRMNYVEKKAFHVKVKGHKKYSYYDLLQYFQISLNKASLQYLNKEKKDFAAKYSSKPLYDCTATVEQEIARFTKHYRSVYSDNPVKLEKEIKEMTEFFSKFKSAIEYRLTLIEYAKEDAVLCRDLGRVIVHGVNSFVNIRNFNSSATISEYYFRSNGISVPKLGESVFKQFAQPYGGGRFELTCKGWIQRISMYDIKSAYPYAMSLMPILSKNPIVKNVYRMNESSLYGTYCINAKIPEDLYLSPLFKKGQILKFPVGNFVNHWVEKPTLELLDEMGIKYHIIKATEIYDPNHDFRLTPLIDKLFAIKEDKKNPEVVRVAAKIILNSLYGKFIQLNDDVVLEMIQDLDEIEEITASALFNIAGTYYKRVHCGVFSSGKLFAPQYASYITAHTRAYLYRTALKVGLENVIGFHTDSIILRNGKTLETGHKLGQWEIEELKDKSTGKKLEVRDLNMILLKTGLYSVEHEGLKKIRARGIGRTDNLLQDKFTVSRRYGLKQAVRRDFINMNIISEEEVKNNLNADLKRVWKDRITIAEIQDDHKMIESRPFVI